jgi:hypothetical protein
MPIRIVMFLRSVYLAPIRDSTGFPEITRVCCAVARLAVLDAVFLDHLRVIDRIAEGTRHRVQIGPVAVRGQLHPHREARGQIVHEGAGRLRVTRSDHPRRDQLGIWVERHEGPHVALAERALLVTG